MYLSWRVQSPISPDYNNSYIHKKGAPGFRSAFFYAYFFYFTTSTHLPGVKACMVLSYIASQEVAGR